MKVFVSFTPNHRTLCSLSSFIEFDVFTLLADLCSVEIPPPCSLGPTLLCKMTFNRVQISVDISPTFSCIKSDCQRNGCHEAVIRNLSQLIRHGGKSKPKGIFSNTLSRTFRLIKQNSDSSFNVLFRDVNLTVSYSQL